MINTIVQMLHIPFYCGIVKLPFESRIAGLQENNLHHVYEAVVLCYYLN